MRTVIAMITTKETSLTLLALFSPISRLTLNSVLRDLCSLISGTRLSQTY
ncbi:unnamed protein product [Medioppia subpectinata]|uniref:Uncharacterized protein n=1 Tax=Medioppia subpectinata TaxID=1979941 RepID=A0A7R9QP09_9ACAR|nr:unnamed protein product [Medioppia subpectinata]CAG2123361.1 unnamed protein product [Medioppia subpectinata]